MQAIRRSLHFVRHSRLAATGLFAIVSMAGVGTLPDAAHATTISTGPASSPIGPVQCQGGHPAPICLYQAFDTTSDLAFSGGSAASTVASSTLPGFPAIHDAAFINDGQYGNGRSWIGNSPGAWIKIDLGSVQSIGQISFGRDRLGNFDDRDPGPFLIDFALSDAIYANGNDAEDLTEYSNAVDSSALGFSGIINFNETIVIDFDTPITAR